MTNEARWLRELAKQVAKAPPPEVDWARVEQRLFERIDLEPRALRPRIPEVPWRQLVALASIAAATVLAAHGLAGSSPSESTAYTPSRGNAGIIPLASLAAISPPTTPSGLKTGDHLGADVDLRFAHDDWAMFSVRQGSEVTVERLQETVVLALESGAVEVAVRPGQQPGSFVVRAGRTAVAVHGTRFLVERRADDVLVRVREGSVSVGTQSRRGPTVRWLVAAGSEGIFSLDGATEASFGSAPASPGEWRLEAATPGFAAAKGPGWPGTPRVLEEAREPTTHPGNVEAQAVEQRPPATAQLPATGSPAGSSQPLEESLTLATAEPALSTLLERIRGCYRAALGSTPSDVRVTVRSTLTMSVAADGHVVLGRFEPPLKPEAQVCASDAVRGARFPEARGESTLRVQLEF